MKKILVPTDFSKVSNHTVDFSTYLAYQLQAEVYIVHFVDVMHGEMNLHLSGQSNTSGNREDTLFEAQMLRLNASKLEKMAALVSADGVRVTVRQLGGGFLNGIQHFVETNAIDLVVIGTTGEERIQEFFTGNHTEQLIEHLNIPVLSIRDEVERNILDVVIGVDLIDEHYSKSAFNKIKFILEGLDARVHIVNVINEKIPDKLLLNLNKLANVVGIKNYLVDVISAENKMDGFLDYVHEVDAGMVITLTEARSGIYRFFQHSFTTKLTKIASVPVLTFNKGYRKVLDGGRV